MFYIVTNVVRQNFTTRVCCSCMVGYPVFNFGFIAKVLMK